MPNGMAVSLLCPALRRLTGVVDIERVCKPWDDTSVGFWMTLSSCCVVSLCWPIPGLPERVCTRIMCSIVLTH